MKPLYMLQCRSCPVTGPLGQVARYPDDGEIVYEVLATIVGDSSHELLAPGKDAHPHLLAFHVKHAGHALHVVDNVHGDPLCKRFPNFPVVPRHW